MISWFSAVHTPGSSPYTSRISLIVGTPCPRSQTHLGGILGSKTISNHLCAYHMYAHKFWGHSHPPRCEFRRNSSSVDRSVYPFDFPQRGSSVPPLPSSDLG